MKRMYVLNGDPLQLVRSDRENEYMAQKIAIQSAQITLNLQHDEQPPLKGLLRVHYSFFLPLPKRGPNMRLSYGDAHIGRPHIMTLLKFFDRACRGVLWNDAAQLYSVSINKVYDSKPRTELIIAELTDE